MGEQFGNSGLEEQITTLNQLPGNDFALAVVDEIAYRADGFKYNDAKYW